MFYQVKKSVFSHGKSVSLQIHRRGTRNKIITLFIASLRHCLRNETRGGGRGDVGGGLNTCLELSWSAVYLFCGYFRCAGVPGKKISRVQPGVLSLQGHGLFVKSSQTGDSVLEDPDTRPARRRKSRRARSDEASKGLSNDASGKRPHLNLTKSVWGQQICGTSLEGNLACSHTHTHLWVFIWFKSLYATRNRADKLI